MSKPAYFDQLSETDQQAYRFLQMSLSAPGCKNRRNKALSTFQDLVDCVHHFVIGTNDDQWKRALVCGICWFGNSIAVNRHQFSILTSKSKSSINGLFQSLGYGTIPYGCDAAAPLLAYFPFLHNNFAELRRWTVRQKMSATPPPDSLLTQVREHYSARQSVTPPPADPDPQLPFGKTEDAWDPFSFWDPENF
jgi:hypothetical protein